MADRQDTYRGFDRDRQAAGRVMPSNSYVPQNRGPGAQVDRSQETYDPSPYRPRVVTPHGTVSADGRRAEPEHSLTSRVLVYGGAAVCAAALTAGAVMAVRTVVDRITGNDEIDRDADRAADRARAAVHDRASGRPSGRGQAPRFADLTDDERARMRARAAARLRADEAERARQRSRAAADLGPRDERGDDADRRPRPMRPDHRHDPRMAHGRPRRPQPRQESFFGGIEHTGNDVVRTISDVMQGLAAAMEGFRQVAGQAEGVVREFSNTADSIRGFLDSGRGDDRASRHSMRSARAEDAFKRPARRDVVDLRDNEAGLGDTPAANTARTHRL